MNKPAFEIVVGIPEVHRVVAARLYDQAFGQKLSLAIPKTADRLALYESHFDLTHAIGAVSGNALIGLAGFSTQTGSLTGSIEYSHLLSNLGFLGGNWAALVLTLYDRKACAGELLMDGIAVDAQSRGMGVGTQLLSCLIDYARENGYSSIRLDVIDTNSGARKLYERIGFIESRTEQFEILRPHLGFGASTTFCFTVESAA